MAGNGGFAGGVRTTRVLERIRASVGQGDEKRKEVLAVPCPKCGVKESKSCTGKGDQLRWAFHAERRKAARVAVAASDAAAVRRPRAPAAAPVVSTSHDPEAERRWAWIREQMVPEQLVSVEGAARTVSERHAGMRPSSDRAPSSSQAARAMMAAEALRDR